MRTFFFLANLFISVYLFFTACSNYQTSQKACPKIMRPLRYASLLRLVVLGLLQLTESGPVNTVLVKLGAHDFGEKISNYSFLTSIAIAIKFTITFESCFEKLTLFSVCTAEENCEIQQFQNM